MKRNPVSQYRAQRRGGRGKTGAVARDEDFLEMLFVASTHSYLLVFSDKGKVYWLKVHEIPQAGRAARGKPIVNLVQLAQGEKVAAILPVRELPEPPAGEEGEGEAGAERPGQEAGGEYVFLATRRGLIKKTAPRRLQPPARRRASSPSASRRATSSSPPGSPTARATSSSPPRRAWPSASRSRTCAPWGAPPTA